jgi:hypothetical protein
MGVDVVRFMHPASLIGVACPSRQGMQMLTSYHGHAKIGRQWAYHQEIF